MSDIFTINTGTQINKACTSVYVGRQAGKVTQTLCVDTNCNGPVTTGYWDYISGRGRDESPLQNPTNYSAFPTGSAAAVITVAAAEGKYWSIQDLEFSYSGTPAAGSLTIEYGGTGVRTYYITSGGPGPIEYEPPLYNNGRPTNQALVITLSAEAGLTGSLSARIV